MAQTARARYVGGATYGSAAYDLERLREIGNEAYAEEEYAERPQEKQQIRIAARTHTAAAIRISPVTVVGVLMCIALTVLLLLANVQLTEIAAETSELKSQLSALDVANEQLVMEYESAFNLDEIESFAKYELGLVKPTAEQIKILNIYSGDKGVILGNTESIKMGKLESVWSFLLSLKEYF